MTPDLLDAAAVLALARRGALPERWRMVVADGALRPLHPPGAVLTVVRSAPRAGAVACLARGSRVAWRRVLAVRDDEALVRAEVAPFPDGWTADVLGVVAPAGALDRVAARAPVAWTSGAWWGALGVAWARALSRQARYRLAPRVSFRVVTLGPDDAAAFDALYTRAFGPAPGGYPMPAGHTVLGLLAPPGEVPALVGSRPFAVRDGEAYCSGLVVDPRWRGRGGGALLCAATLDAARVQGARVARGHIAARNFASQKTLGSVGFRPTGRWRRWPDDPLLAAERQEMEWVAPLSPSGDDGGRRFW